MQSGNESLSFSITEKHSSVESSLSAFREARESVRQY